MENNKKNIQIVPAEVVADHYGYEHETERLAPIHITDQAREDFNNYKNVKVRQPNGKRLIINRKDIEAFFSERNKPAAVVTAADLQYGYPGASIDVETSNL